MSFSPRAQTRTVQENIAEAHSVSDIFRQEWWLNIAAESNLRCVEVGDDDSCKGKLFFVETRTKGIRTITAPPYTRTCGPLLKLPSSKEETRIGNTIRLVKSITEKLPKHDRFQMCLNPRDECGFAFALAGFNVEMDFTFRTQQDDTPESLWAKLHWRTRSHIRNASEQFLVEEKVDAESFIKLSRLQHGDGNHHNFNILSNLIAAATSRDQCTMQHVVDSSGNRVASSVLLWDDEVLYYWQGTRDPRNKSHGANALLVWEAIKLAIAKSLIFDIDSYYSRAQAMFNTKFGLAPVVRPTVIRLNNRAYLARRITLQFGHPLPPDRLLTF